MGIDKINNIAVYLMKINFIVAFFVILVCLNPLVFSVFGLILIIIGIYLWFSYMPAVLSIVLLLYCRQRGMVFNIILNILYLLFLILLVNYLNSFLNELLID